MKSKTCRQCFEEYDTDAAMFDDGFCSDYCFEKFDDQLTAQEPHDCGDPECGPMKMNKHTRR